MIQNLITVGGGALWGLVIGVATAPMFNSKNENAHLFALILTSIFGLLFVIVSLVKFSANTVLFIIPAGILFFFLGNRLMLRKKKDGQGWIAKMFTPDRPEVQNSDFQTTLRKEVQ